MTNSSTTSVMNTSTYAAIMAHVVSYAVSSISAIYSFGAVLGVTYFVQILSGVFLALYYAGSSTPFDTILLVVREGNTGFIARPLHTVGCSLVFMFMVVHFIKAQSTIFTGSVLGVFTTVNSINNTNLHSLNAPLLATLTSGFFILLISMAIAFTGYSSVFGNMSFWGISVILAIANVLDSLLFALYGGFAVGYSTVGVLFVLHFLLPFVALIIVCIHIMLLHVGGSTAASSITNPCYSPSNISTPSLIASSSAVDDDIKHVAVHLNKIVRSTNITANN